MKQIKLGLIGLGYIGQVHLRNCLRLQNAKLEAVADVSKKALSSAKRLGVNQTFQDYNELLKEESLDAVIISLPTHLHATCATAAAEAGKHILLEKPLARNVNEGKQILSATEKKGVTLMIGYPFRFAPQFQILKQKILTGELGEVQIAFATNIGPGPFTHRAESDAPKPVPEWWFKKELTGGGALMDLGSHMINLIRWYFGEVSDTKSYIGHRFNLEQEDHALCMLKLKNGQLATVNVGWFSQETKISVELFGTSGHAILAHETPSKIKTAIKLMMKRTPDFYISFLKEIQHFTYCIENDQQPKTSGNDALKDLETIAKAYENQIHLN